MITENKQSNTNSPESQTPLQGTTRIIVEHTFGELDLTELYAAYIADKFMSKSAENISKIS